MCRAGHRTSRALDLRKFGLHRPGNFFDIVDRPSGLETINILVAVGGPGVPFLANHDSQGVKRARDEAGLLEENHVADPGGVVGIHGLLQDAVDVDIRKAVIPVFGPVPADGGTSEFELAIVVLDIGNVVIPGVEAILIRLPVPISKTKDRRRRCRSR